MRNRVVLILILLIFSKMLMSQLSIGISLIGLGYHPTSDQNTHLYKWKLDKKGKTIAFTGVTFVATYRINDFLGVKVMQTLVFYDCAGKFAGLTHIGVDFHDDVFGCDGLKNQFSASFGPLWYYRKNWSKYPTYVNDPSFIRLSKSEIWETKFVWYGAVAEYAHYFDDKNAATISLFPGHPYLYTFSVGAKHTY